MTEGCFPAFLLRTDVPLRFAGGFNVMYNHVGVTTLQRGVFVIIMGSPDLERSNLMGISEKQGTCSRT